MSNPEITITIRYQTSDDSYTEWTTNVGLKAFNPTVKKEIQQILEGAKNVRN